MRNNTLNFLIAGLLVLGFVLFNALYVVTEGQVGIVTRFGKVLRGSDAKLEVMQPGLHFKVPFIDKVKILDSRLQTIDQSANRFVTSEKKDVIIDSYVKWRIEDAATYYLTTAGGNRQQAEELLSRKINNSLRSQIGRLTIHEIVSGQDSEQTEDEFDSARADDTTVMGSTKRDEVMQNALHDIGSSARDLGVSIVDVRIKQINLPPEVSNSIYQRMRAERDAVAKLHRSQGRKDAEAIRAQADREVTVKIAEAEKASRTLRGDGDAEAVKIYADAYTRSPELFEFLRSMDAYRSSMTKGRDVLVLKPDSDFFRFFGSFDGKGAQHPQHP
ncbi:MAG: protease modulator HflC [Succinivibrio sp.]|jgi:membrane protease subunit HflC|nr:protease modulator HflC [Succinivibrio sp.]